MRSFSPAPLWAVLISVAACGGKQLPTASPFAGKVLGFVVDEDGLAVIGATVRLTPELGDEYAEEEESVRGGRFFFEDVPPGRRLPARASLGPLGRSTNQSGLLTDRCSITSESSGRFPSPV